MGHGLYKSAICIRPSYFHWVSFGALRVPRPLRSKSPFGRRPRPPWIGGLEKSKFWSWKKKTLCCWMVVSKLISFSPLFVGEDFQIWLIFCQMGWNHQLACFVTLKMKTCKTMGFKRKKQNDCICTYIYPQLAVPLWWILNCTNLRYQDTLPGIDHISPPAGAGSGSWASKTSTVKQKRRVFEWPFLHVGSWYLFFWKI